jgi:hypothetical protein
MKNRGKNDPDPQKRALADYAKSTYKAGLKTVIPRVANETEESE